MFEKIMWWVFSPFLHKLYDKAFKYGLKLGSTAKLLECQLEMNRRTNLMWEASRLGRCKDMYTYRDMFMLGAMVGSVKSVTDLPKSKLDDIYVGSEYPAFAFPDFGKDKTATTN